MNASPQSRVVLLTGAAGGLGSVMAANLLEAGHVVAAVDRNEAALDRLCAAHNQSTSGERLFPIVADLAVERACREAVEKTVARFGRIEGVINNAGIGMSSIRPDAETHHPPIEELTAELWDRFFAINVRGPMLVTRAALSHMRKGGWGRVINNTTSYRTMLRVLPYGATKSALESMSAVWAAQLEGTGITVNVLVPGGPTDTPFISDAAGWPREKMLRPAIMGPPVRWLMSEEADHVTGQRFMACDWDTALPDVAAARRAGRAIGWPELAATPSWW